MIIFIKGPLNVLNYFIDCMAAKEETSIILDIVSEKNKNITLY